MELGLHVRNALRPIRKKLYPTWMDELERVGKVVEKEGGLLLGAGNHSLPGATRVDYNSRVSPDVLWDLNTFPYPFADNTFKMCIALSIVEHLHDFLRVMGELHRITKHSGSVCILVPHFSSSAAFVDPTHTCTFSARSCDYFLPGTPLERQHGYYAPFRYRMFRRVVTLQGALRYLPFSTQLLSRCPDIWEDYFCFIVRGAGIYWELSPIKPSD